MNGYETKQQRDAQIKGLVVELDATRRALREAEARLKGIAGDKIVERATHEERVAGLKQAVVNVEDQLRAFKGEAPHKRAQTRRQGQGAETR